MQPLAVNIRIHSHSCESYFCFWEHILRPIRPYLFTLLGIFNLTDIHNESRHGNLGKPQSSHFYTVSVKVNIVLLFPSCGQWPFLMKLLEYLYISGYPQCHQACLVPLHYCMQETGRKQRTNKNEKWNKKNYIVAVCN